MHQTTVCLPDELKARLERVARGRGCSEADVVREAIERFTASEGRP